MGLLSVAPSALSETPDETIRRLTAELHEAHQQQAATTEILEIINSSGSDLAPVFDAILEKAHNLCGADHGSLFLQDAEIFRAIASRGIPEAMTGPLREGIRANDSSLAQPLMAGQPFVHIHDSALDEHPNWIKRALDVVSSNRTLLSIPLRKGDALLGMIVAGRFEVRPFTEKQIALLQNFAAQAVIAMENARLINETREALEQQTATAEVLQVINSSPGDLAPVFDAILEKAHTLCDTAHGSLQLWDGEKFRGVATRGFSETMIKAVQRGYTPGPNFPSRHIVEGERVVHCVDIVEFDDPIAREGVELSGSRTMLYAALRKDDVLLGQIVSARQEVRPFSEKQIALVENFAAQAVIAMENARLINETREALEQQTATAEVLQAINSSPGDLVPVFETMLDKAIRLCEAAFGIFWTYDGVRFQATALRGVPVAFAEFLRQPLGPFHRGSGLARMLDGIDMSIHPDMAAEEAYQAGDPLRRAIVDLGGARSAITVSLRKDQALLGAFTAFRQQVRPFTDTQIALLQNFAAQAVIAMENARLLTETRETLKQQTATAEVLQVINSSPGNLAPVFDAMLEKAMRLCEAAHGHLVTFDGEVFNRGAANRDPAFTEWWLKQGPMHPPEDSPLGRIVRGEQFIHLRDAKAEGVYHNLLPYRQFIDNGGIRTLAAVALRKDDALLGAILVYRKDVRPFTDKQIALLQNFGAQGVIAMENARLITETREALEQQTATAEVLQVVNASPGDLTPVFDAILEKAHTLCGAAHGALVVRDGDNFRAVATRGMPRPFEEHMRRGFPLIRGGPTDRLMRGDFVHILDVPAAAAESPPELARLQRQAAELAGTRTLLIVPLCKDGVLLGYIAGYRTEVRPFSEKQIAVLQNFAAQAVIAMENARLITETREALEQQTATAEVLGVINSSPGDLTPVFEAMLEKATRLCEAPFGTLRTWDGERFRFGAVYGDPQLSDWVRRRGSFRPDGGQSPLRRIMEGEQIVQVADASSDADYSTSPGFMEMVQASGMRSVITVALRKDETLLGTIHVYRQEVRPFTDKQVALLQNFAAQAVIAMENARLITETREALEQQTATAEVLQVINSSPGDLTPVFESILEKAHALCGSEYGGLVIHEGEEFRMVAAHGKAHFVETWRQLGPVRPPEGSPPVRLIRGERIIHILDVWTDDALRNVPPEMQRLYEVGGVRTMLIVPLRKDGAVLGLITAYRQEVRPFTDKQIALLENFAAQAVIAMENARLLTETREALEQQTATAEVLQVINSSPGDLAPVFDAMLEKATRLCEAPFGTLRTWDGERFHFGAVHGEPWFTDWVRRRHPFQPDRDASPLGRILSGERVVHIPDTLSDESYRTSSGFREMVETSGMRSSIMVALRKDDDFLGTITVYRREVRPFSDKQIALLENFGRRRLLQWRTHG